MPGHYPPNTTPFPNRLLDEAMPHLTDTEFRVLCMVVRETLGWADGQGGRRRETDRLTQRRLIARTGRASEAVSRAIDGLVRQCLIEVLTPSGVLLETPQERRRHRGRLLFRLAATETEQRTGRQESCSE